MVKLNENFQSLGVYCDKELGDPPTSTGHCKHSQCPLAGLVFLHSCYQAEQRILIILSWASSLVICRLVPSTTHFIVSSARDWLNYSAGVLFYRFSRRLHISSAVTIALVF